MYNDYILFYSKLIFTNWLVVLNSGLCFNSILIHLINSLMLISIKIIYLKTKKPFIFL